MEIKQIYPKLYYVKVGNDRRLARMVCRVQEHYESVFPEIQDKIFTLGQLRAAGSRIAPGVFIYTGGYTYKAEWGGYNFPSSALKPFIDGWFDPLTKEEQDLVDAFRMLQGNYYVIATSSKEQGDNLEHEICHGLYTLEKQYREDVQKVLAQYDLSGMKQMLSSWGYPEKTMEDECHAYLSADYDWLKKDHKKDLQKFNIKIPKEAHKKLRYIRARYQVETLV